MTETLTPTEIDAIEKRAIERLAADPTNAADLDLLRVADSLKTALTAAEDAADVAELKAADEIPAGDFLPEDLVARLVDGESPLKIWRKHRGLNQAALAEAAELTQAYLSELETGKKHGAVDVYKRLAEALQITIDDLVR